MTKKSKRCKMCKARFAQKSGYCGPCRELVDERNERTKATTQAMVLGDKVKSLEGQLAAQRKYHVHVPAFQWDAEKTWPEAVTFAEGIAAKGCVPWRVEIRDEYGRVVRCYTKEGLFVKEVELPV